MHLTLPVRDFSPSALCSLALTIIQFGIGPASVGLYAFLYAVFYFLVYDMHMAGSFRSVALYIGYNLIICTGLGLMAGTIGAIASFYFIYKIFGAVKLD